jgi:hypothetical protein
MLSYTKPNTACNSVVAHLSGSSTCTGAGITANSPTPVLALCRELLAAGLDADTAMEVYRAGTLALRVRSLREAARLEINSKGTGFIVRPAVRKASPIARREAPCRVVAP